LLQERKIAGHIPVTAEKRTVHVNLGDVHVVDTPLLLSDVYTRVPISHTCMWYRYVRPIVLVCLSVTLL